MKKTGPTREATRKLVVQLEKYGKANKQRIWIDVSKVVAKPRRSRITVNLWKIGKLAAKFKGKILVVAGKVTSVGKTEGVNVAAKEFSERALVKIKEGGGKAFTLSELMEAKPKASDLVIIK